MKDAIQNQTKVSDADAKLQTFKTQVLIFNSDQLLLTLFANGADQNLAKGAGAGLKELNTASKRIKPDQDKLAEVVKEKGKEVKDANDKHLLYELAAVLLQIAIVLASVSIIARRRFLLYGGQFLGAAGVVVLVVGLVH